MAQELQTRRSAIGIGLKQSVISLYCEGSGMLIATMKRLVKRGTTQTASQNPMAPERSGSSTPYRGVVTFGLSLVILTGAVTFPGCGRPEEADSSSDVQGVGAVAGKEALSEAAEAALKNFDAALKSAVKGMKKSANAPVNTVQIDNAVKGVIVRTAAAGVDRYRLQLLLEDAIENDPITFGAKSKKPEDVEKRADTILAETEKQLDTSLKKETSPENKEKIKKVLAKLREKDDVLENCKRA